jgi:hypothetical protein
MISLDRAILIYARADDLKFLGAVRNKLASILAKRLMVIELKDRRSHGVARDALRNCGASFTIIMAHGGSDYLLGGDYRLPELGEAETRDKFFMLEEHAEIFSGKAVFSLSCDSREMAEACLGAGAIAFVGFGSVPFNIFDDNGDARGNRDLVVHTQRLIADGVRSALSAFVSGKLNLRQAVDHLCLWMSKESVRFVKENASIKDRKIVAALLLQVKNGVRYFGSEDVHFKGI